MLAQAISLSLHRRGVHYAWVIAGVTFLAMLTTSAALGLPGAMLQPLSREFGWNTDELEDHHVPAGRRRTVLREYVEAMRALWTQEEASYTGEFVSFGPSWAYPKPVQAHIPLIIGAGGGPKTFRWIARHADGWMTTPNQTDISGQIAALKTAWTDEGRDGIPDIRVLIAFRPDPDDLVAWAEAGVSELIWGVPDKAEDEVLASLGRLAGRLGIG